jgi:hypothetical protein
MVACTESPSPSTSGPVLTTQADVELPDTSASFTTEVVAAGVSSGYEPQPLVVRRTDISATRGHHEDREFMLPSSPDDRYPAASSGARRVEDTGPRRA